ncbi:MAG: Ig-like domain-containing protein, partial [Bacteroidota bacterium]
MAQRQGEVHGKVKFRWEFEADPAEILIVTARDSIQYKPGQPYSTGSFAVQAAYADSTDAPLANNTTLTFTASSTTYGSLDKQYCYMGCRRESRSGTADGVKYRRARYRVSYVADGNTGDGSPPAAAGPLTDTRLEVSVTDGEISGSMPVVILGPYAFDLRAQPDSLLAGSNERSALTTSLVDRTGTLDRSNLTVDFEIDDTDLARFDGTDCASSYGEGPTLTGVALADAESGCIKLAPSQASQTPQLSRVGAPGTSGMGDQGGPSEANTAVAGTGQPSEFRADSVTVTARLVGGPDLEATAPVRIYRPAAQLLLREEDPDGDGIFRIWVETPAGYACQTSCTDVRVTVDAGLLYNPITGEQGTTLLVGWDTITGVGIQYYPTPDAPDPPNEETVVATATPETPIQNDDGEPIEGDSEEILVIQRPTTPPPSNDPDSPCGDPTVPQRLAVAMAPPELYAGETSALSVTALNCAGAPVTLDAGTTLYVLLNRGDGGHLADGNGSVPGTTYVTTTYGAIGSVYLQAVEEAPEADTPVAVVVTMSGASGEAAVTVLADVAPVDLRIDSDNDGQITEADEAIENDPARLGALVAYNTDDDDGNDVPDYDDAGGFADDDLERIDLVVPDLDTGTVTLSVTAGASQFRVWTDASKGTEVVLPVTWDVTAVPEVLFIEGIAWEETYAGLRLELDEGIALPPDDRVDDIRFYVGDTGLSFPTQAVAGSEPYAYVGGFPNQSDLQLRVYRDDVLVTESNLTVSELAFVEPVAIPLDWDEIGRQYRVEVVADQGQLVLQSEPCIVVVDAPHTVVLGHQDNGGFVADGISTRAISAVVRDRTLNNDGVGYPVAGVPVSFWVTDSFGSTIERVATTDADGVATVTLTAPLSGSTSVKAHAGTVTSEVLLVEATPLTLRLDPTSDTLDVATQEAVTFTLYTNATPGTPVYWTLSNLVPGADAYPQGIVSAGGTAQLVVQGEGARVGEGVVTATVGTKLVAYEIDYVSSAPLSAEVEYNYIAGDTETSGLYDERLEYPVPVALQGELGVSTSRPVQIQAYVAAASPVIVRGEAFTRYRVELTDPADANYVTLVGLTGSELEIGPEGEFTFFIESTGTWPGNELEREIAFQIVEVEPPTARVTSPNTTEARIYLAPRRTIALDIDFFAETFRGFLGQDVTTAEGYHAYLEAAMGNSILSRIGAIAKQDLRWGPSGKLLEWLSDDPVPERDNYEMAFAAASILAQFVEGMVDDEGSIIDEVIIAKTSRVPWVGSAILALREKVDAGALSDYLARYAAIAMFVESGPFQDQLGDQFLGEVQSELIDCFTKAIVERECFDDMHAFAISLSDRPAFIRFAERVFTSPDAYGWGRDVYEQYGDDFSDAAQLLVENNEEGPETERGISERAGYRWLGVLANSAPLKDDLTASGDAGYYLLRLGEALDDSRLHWKAVEDVLAINDFDAPGPPEAYTRAEFVEDMADLAGALRTDEARNNFRELTREITKEAINSPGDKGMLYELTASARLVRDSDETYPNALPSRPYPFFYFKPNG